MARIFSGDSKIQLQGQILLIMVASTPALPPGDKSKPYIPLARNMMMRAPIEVDDRGI